MPEKSKPVNDAAMRAVAILPAIGTLYAAQDTIKSSILSVFGPPYDAVWAAHSTLGCIVAAAVYVAIEIVSLGRAAIVSVFGRKEVYFYLEPDFDLEKEAEKLASFAYRTLGPLATTASLNNQKISMVLKKNPAYVWALSGSKSRIFLPKKEMKAFFIAAGLTKKAENDIMSGKIINGHQINESQLASNFEEASSIYIFGVYADAKNSRLAACAVSSLAVEMSRLVERYKIKYVFARPGTEAGRVQMKRFFFREINNSEIQHVNRAHVRDMWPRYQQVAARHAVRGEKVEAD